LKCKHNLSLLLFQCALEYTVMRVEANAKSFQLRGTYQLSVYANYGNKFGGSVSAIKKNTGALVVASKKINLEVKAEKAKYMVMFRE